MGVMEDGSYVYVHDQSIWDEFMVKLKSLGCDTFILQQSVNEPCYSCFDIPGIQTKSTYYQSVSSILAAAANNDIHVYLGLYAEKAPTGGWAFNHNNDDDFKAFLDRVCDYDKGIIQATEALIQANPKLGQAFAGYYLPQEIAQSQNVGEPIRLTLLDHLLIPVTNETHKFKRMFMLSPYFTDIGGTPLQEGELWSYLLTQKGSSGAFWQPDIVMPQDGVGVGHVAEANVKAFFEAYQDAFGKLKPPLSAPQLWLDFELFSVSEVDQDPEQLNTRLAKEKDYASKVIGFSMSKLLIFDHQVSPTKLYEVLSK